MLGATLPFRQDFRRQQPNYMPRDAGHAAKLPPLVPPADELRLLATRYGVVAFADFAASVTRLIGYAIPFFHFTYGVPTLYSYAMFTRCCCLLRCHA